MKTDIEILSEVLSLSETRKEHLKFDSTLIVLYANEALFAMRQVRSQMQARIDELEKYADHLEGCDRSKTYADTDVCTCGLDELLK